MNAQDAAEEITRMENSDSEYASASESGKSLVYLYYIFT